MIRPFSLAVRPLNMRPGDFVPVAALRARNFEDASIRSGLGREDARCLFDIRCRSKNDLAVRERQHAPIGKRNRAALDYRVHASASSINRTLTLRRLRFRGASAATIFSDPLVKRRDRSVLRLVSLAWRFVGCALILWHRRRSSVSCTLGSRRPAPTTIQGIQVRPRWFDAPSQSSARNAANGYGKPPALNITAPWIQPVKKRPRYRMRMRARVPAAIKMAATAKLNVGDTAVHNTPTAALDTNFAPPLTVPSAP